MDSIKFFLHVLILILKLLRIYVMERTHIKSAAFYKDLVSNVLGLGSLASYTQLQGKELSYNNIADADAAWECVKTFDSPACVIVKHANPCGVAVSANHAYCSLQNGICYRPNFCFRGNYCF